MRSLAGLCSLPLPQPLPRLLRQRRLLPAPATAADVKAGAPLRDMDGAPVGTIVSSTDQAVVVDTGQTKIGVPLTMFRKDDKGLLLGITAKQFSDAVAKAHARSQAQQPGAGAATGTGAALTSICRAAR